MPPPAERRNTSALILAGGRGRRLGGRDKGWIEVDGRPLIERLLMRLRPQVTTLSISANRNMDRYRALGVPVLADSLPDYPGPLAGIQAGLQACTTPWLLVAPVDSPWLPLDLRARLAAALGPALAVQVQVHERPYPTCALLHRGLAAPLTAFLASGQRRARDWYQAIGAAALDLSEQAGAFRNINHPEDLPGSRP